MSKPKRLDEFIVPGKYLLEEKAQIIPVSPKLDTILGGGLSFGSFVVVSGPPKKGKSSTILDIIGTASNIKHDGKPRNIYYFDVEARLEQRNLLGIHSLKEAIEENRFRVVRSKEGEILSAEDYITFAEELLLTDSGCICVIDSLSQLCSKSAYVHDWDKRFRDDVPMILSLFIKRISHSLRLNKNLLIGITHRIANTSGMGYAQWSEASGTKVQYRADTKLNIKYAENWCTVDNGQQQNIGLNIHWECSASPLVNGPSIPETNSYFRFGFGIDKPLELLEVCSDLGIIQKKGSWYEFDYPSQTKIQGQEKGRNFLADSKVYNYYYEKYREFMQLKC